MDNGKIITWASALQTPADPEVITAAVDAYLEEHPPAIDDTAGSGDTDKLWSADKTAGEVATLTEAIEKKPEVKDSTKTGVDLDVSDEDGNVILRLKDGNVQTKKFCSAKLAPKIVTLKTSGGDYSTLKAALESITDADPDTNPYEIHVYPGTYDTLSGFTPDEIRAADIGGGYTDSSMVGCKLTNGISLIGIGDRSKIILTAELATADYSAAVRGNISTINMQGTCRLENVTVKAKLIRYCVHDDFGASGHYERIVRNCSFIGLGTSMSYYPPTTYGAGIANPGITALFEDCDFGYNWGMHTRQQTMTGDSLVILRNCRGLTARIGDQAYQNDTAKHTFIFDNCDFDGINMARPNTTVPHCFLQGTKNKSMLFCPTDDIPLFANVMKTALSTLPVGTLVNVSNGEMTSTSSGIKAVKATSMDAALGVIVDKDDLYDYIQKDGFLQGNRLGISSLSVGDYLTIDADMKLTSGGTSSNAFAVVKYTDSDDRSQIWIMGR